jgi:hypothetical protein
VSANGRCGSVGTERLPERARRPRWGRLLAAAAITIGALATSATGAVATPLFSKLPGEMLERRYYPAAALLPTGKVLLAGGYNVGNGYLANAELFNPATDTFEALAAKMTSERDEPGWVVLPDGRVLIAGGTAEPGGKFEYLKSAELFDPASMTFEALGAEMTAQRDGPAVAMLPSGKVLIAGGYGEPTGFQRSAELYDPSTRTFTAIAGEMVTARYGPAVGALPNGKVLIAGGYNETKSLQSAELFNPTTNTFEALTGATHELTEKREEPGHVVLADGDVLLVGGYNETRKDLKTVELFNWESETFEKLPGELAGQRTGASAALLLDGRVLLAGGYNEALSGAERDLTTAELRSVAAPAVTTGSASGIGAGFATLTGAATGETVTSSFFQFGPTTAYGETSAKQAVAASNRPQPFSSAVAALLAGTTYHFRAVSENAGGATYGADQTFTTPERPVIGRATQSHRRWRRAGRLAAITRRRPPVGTVFAFTLDQPAAVAFAFTQPLGGRVVNRRCVSRTKANAHKKACRLTLTRGLLTFAGHTGANRVAFQGRVSRTRRLTPGTYTLAITATNAAGQASAPARLTFTIVG